MSQNKFTEFKKATSSKLRVTVAGEMSSKNIRRDFERNQTHPRWVAWRKNVCQSECMMRSELITAKSKMPTVRSRCLHEYRRNIKTKGLTCLSTNNKWINVLVRHLFGLFSFSLSVLKILDLYANALVVLLLFVDFIAPSLSFVVCLYSNCVHRLSRILFLHVTTCRTSIFPNSIKTHMKEESCRRLQSGISKCTGWKQEGNCCLKRSIYLKTGSIWKS